YKAILTKLMDDFTSAKDVQTQIEVLKQINEEKGHLETMAVLSSIRHSIDTTDPFYEEENNYWDEHGPLFGELDNKVSQALVSSPYLDELKNVFPKQLFTL